MLFSAPGKIILSGEHAVVYGKPALVMAVNRYAVAGAELGGKDSAGDEVAFTLRGYGAPFRVALSRMDAVLERLAESYGLFEKGALPIRDVLRHPLEILLFALARLLTSGKTELKSGLRLDLSTDIPVGCGMGASAALVLASIGAFAAALDLRLTPVEAFRLAMEAEKLQHGRTSGADPWICAHGGCAMFREGVAEPLELENPGWRIIHTGKARGGTGEAVSRVGQSHGESGIWDDFAACTAGMRAALEVRDSAAIHHSIRANHRLLCEIGVVPAKVRRFISAVERLGGSAKVSGAGAVSGEAAGVVLALSPAPLDSVCERFGYGVEVLDLEPRGLGPAAGPVSRLHAGRVGEGLERGTESHDAKKV